MKTLKRYSLGYILCAAITIVAFYVVQLHLSTDHVFPTHEILLPILVLLGVLQLLFQLTFFLHVGDEKEPRQNLQALLFALLIVTILVGGTLWVMHNLARLHGVPASQELYYGNTATPQSQIN